MTAPDRLQRLTLLFDGLEDALASGGRSALHDMVQAWPGLAFLATMDGGLLEFSCEWCDLLGYTPAELRERGWRACVHPDDADKTEGLVQEMRGGQPAMRFRNRYLTKGGKVVHLVWTATPFIGLRDTAATLAIAEVEKAECSSCG